VPPDPAGAGPSDARVAELRDAVERNPDDPRRLLALAAALHGRRDPAALTLAERAAALDPANRGYRIAQAAFLREQGKLAEAEIAYRRGLSAETDPAIWLDFGIVVQQRGRAPEAEAIFRRVIARAPDLAAAHSNLGNVLIDLRRLEEAVASFRTAVRLDPALAPAWTNLARACLLMDRHAEAHAALQQALPLRPEDPRLLNDLGVALFGMGDLAAAAEMYRRSLARDPAALATLKNFAGVLRWSAAFAEACSVYRRILAQEPDNPAALNGLAVCASAIGDFAGREEARARLLALAPAALAGADSWDLLVSLAYTDTTLAWPDRWRARVTGRLGEVLSAAAARIALPPATPARAAAPRLRIGYVSPNFGDHPVGHVTASLFGAHDRAGFEVHGISLSDRSAETEDFARRIAGSFDRLHPVPLSPPPVAAAAIAALGLDILVDLNGYLARSPAHVLAFRPAPVQVFWLGHAGGLGVPWIDYLIADRIVVPPGEEGRYAERIVRLPDCYHCADRHPIAPVPPTRAESGLPAEGFVFCGFNHPAKFDRALLAAWMAILARVPGSVLWLSNPDQGAGLEDNLRRVAAAAGIDPARLVFARRIPDKALHLARHVHAGLFLDSFVHTASTTALDALWAGLPVLTRRGDRWAGRIAETMLTAVGLPDLVAASAEDYVERAVALAGDPAARASLAARLATNRLTHPLFDTPRFARHLEEAYRRMAEGRAQGLPPAAFDVAG